MFASGTLFAPVTYKGTTFAPGFANNAFIFPGVAAGSLASGASSVTDGMFLAAARSLASRVSEENLAVGAVYPPTSTIREAAIGVGAAVAAAAAAEGVAASRRVQRRVDSGPERCGGDEGSVAGCADGW